MSILYGYERIPTWMNFNNLNILFILMLRKTKTSLLIVYFHNFKLSFEIKFRVELNALMPIVLQEHYLNYIPLCIYYTTLAN